MSALDKYMRAADEVIAIEPMLQEEDFSTYSCEALEFEKKELSKAWAKYKKLYEECSLDTMERKKDIINC